jgi:hypothetical protein
MICINFLVRYMYISFFDERYLTRLCYTLSIYRILMYKHIHSIIHIYRKYIYRHLNIYMHRYTLKYMYISTFNEKYLTSSCYTISEHSIQIHIHPYNVHSYTSKYIFVYLQYIKHVNVNTYICIYTYISTFNERYLTSSCYTISECRVLIKPPPLTLLFTYKNICIYKHIYIYYKNMNIYICICIYKYVYTYKHIFINIHVFIYM